MAGRETPLPSGVGRLKGEQPRQAWGSGLEQSRVGSKRWDRASPFRGLRGDKGCWQCPTSIKQKAQEGEGCLEEPQDQALPPPVQCLV